MKEYAKNPRRITTERLEELRENIALLGDLSGIVVDLNTDEIITGNQRSKVIDINACEIEIVERFSEPDKQGTVAYGYAVTPEGIRMNYREVRWTDKKRERANITANAMGGEFDWEQLQSLFDTDDLAEWGLSDVADMFVDDQQATGESEHKYTRKIVAPVYEPSETCPELSECVNRDKCDSLVQEIREAKLPKEVEQFLVMAAGRHIVFDYSKIADYYAHAPKRVQELMERSALVIIDFDKAIENGYVKLSDRIRKEYIKTYGNEEA